MFVLGYIAREYTYNSSDYSNDIIINNSNSDNSSDINFNANSSDNDNNMTKTIVVTVMRTFAQTKKVTTVVALSAKVTTAVTMKIVIVTISLTMRTAVTI